MIKNMKKSIVPILLEMEAENYISIVRDKVRGKIQAFYSRKDYNLDDFKYYLLDIIYYEHE